MEEVGDRIVGAVRSAMKIDAEWSVDRPGGFTWWAGPLAQHVWTDPPIDDRGIRLSRIHARTDLLADFAGTDKQVSVVSLQSRFATSSALIRDPADPQRIQMACAIWAHAQTEEDIRQLASWVTAIQATEAQLTAGMLAEMADCRVAESAHPRTGRRVELDGMLDVIRVAVAPKGREASFFHGPEMEQVRRTLERPPCVLATGDDGGFAAEYPFRDGTSLFMVATGEANPRMGNGCLMTISLPLGGDDPETARRALELNALEATSAPPMHLLGSWCASPRGLSFVSFIPNALYRRNLCFNLAFAFLNRIRWVTQSVFGFDVDAAFPEAFAARQEMLVGRPSRPPARKVDPSA